MLRSKVLAGVLICAAASVFAHPMGNFSVSHYSKLMVTPKGIELTYALDLAELPTFELLRDWKLEKSSPRVELDRKTSEQAGIWLAKLKITEQGKAVPVRFESAHLDLADGAGDLPIARVTIHAHVSAGGGSLAFLDENYSERAGWKEIVIQPAPGVTLVKASQGDKDVSKGLKSYPPDPTLAPPQDLRAALTWTVEAPLMSSTKPPAATPAAGVTPVIQALPQPHAAPAAASPATMTQQSAPAGSVVRGDYLSRLLHERDLTPWMIAVAIAAAFVLGAAHALTPGHGKTIVAAYLVGARGTLKHAAFLGAMVTFTHTISVFALGLATMFLFRYIVPEKITAVLGAISGLSIVAIGAWMFYQRLRGKGHGHSHSHEHGHSHDHGHAQVMAGHGHEHLHQSGAGGHAHDHEHVHAFAGQVSDHHHEHADSKAHSHDHEVGTGGHSHDHDHVNAKAGTDVHHHVHADGTGHSHVHEHETGGHSHDHDHVNAKAGQVADHHHVHADGTSHSHDHEHVHAAGHSHDHDHDHDHGHGHHHGPGGHSHMPDEISWGGLAALGASGGLVPCEAALVLLLSAIALGRVGLGLVLLVSFSLGLALVLVIIGILVLYAKNLIPERTRNSRSGFFRWVPVASAAFVMIVGLVMTGVSLGWIEQRWMI